MCANRSRPPEVERKRVEALRASLAQPGMLEKKRRIARKNAAARMAWCPAPYREAYRHLRKAKGFGAEEAERLIRDQIANDFRGIDPFAVALITAGLAA